MNIPDQNDIVIEMSESPFGEAFKPEVVETSEVIHAAKAQDKGPTFFQKTKNFCKTSFRGRYEITPRSKREGRSSDRRVREGYRKQDRS